jgi:predicted transcriptional regulator
MSALTNADLITRKNGKYFLTSFGKVVYEAHTLIGRARQNYWKLKAFDAIESSNAALAPEERGRLINSLIEDNDLKQILLSSNENKESLAQQQSLVVPKIPQKNIDF